MNKQEIKKLIRQGPKVGKVKMSQIKQIAETKMSDLNAFDIDAAMRTIIGTARNMGITVEE